MTSSRDPIQSTGSSDIDMRLSHLFDVFLLGDLVNGRTHKPEVHPERRVSKTHILVNIELGPWR